MTGLCGWIGAHRPSADAGALLSQSLDRIPALPDAIDTRFIGDSAAVAVRARPGAMSVADVEGIAVACVGRLRWREDTLSRIAAERGDAQALLEAYRRYGSGLLSRLGGAFALAVLDASHERALLAIDRLGSCGLCYAHCGTELVFGTTTDSVAVHPEAATDVSPQAIYNYLYCHMVPSPGTIYRDMFKLQPGQCVWFERGHLETRFYWTLHFDDTAARDFKAFAREFHGLLREGVVRSVGADPIGTFLSGGTDSSTITGILTEVLGRPTDTYSIGFEAEGFDEMEYARATARHFGAHGHEYYVTPQDVVDAVPRIAAAYDEPFGNASAVPTYYCAKAAREDGKSLLLAGDGGDEIFGGNARYAKQLLFEGYWAIPDTLRSRLIEPAVLDFPGIAHIPPLRKLASYIRQARVPLPDRLETYNFLERDLDEVLEPDFARQINPREPAEISREAYDRTDSRFALNRMMHLDLKQTLADNDLRKVNRMCLVAGIEVRYPLLDDDLVEFSGRLPACFKVRRLALRWFFKQALRDFLPPETLAKTKHGFGLPFGLWLNRHPALLEITRESLRSLRQRGIIRQSYLDHITAMHRSDQATYYGVMIWVLMMLEQWFQSHRS